jgi:hypothetical protein
MHYNCSMHSTVQRILSRNLLDRDNRRAIGRQTGKRSARGGSQAWRSRVPIF